MVKRKSETKDDDMVPNKRNAVCKRKPPAKKAYELAVPLPEGTVLTDMVKRQWLLGKPFAVGGFGRIYLGSLASDNKTENKYAVKLEPQSNGPLFCEMHFYQRIAKPEKVATWMATRKLKQLGIPTDVTFGYHQRGQDNYRFMVMPRYGSDLEKVFDDRGRKFSATVAFSVALKVLNCLEYLHEHEYVHADIKASNLLLGLNNPDEIFLVDYGLAFRYTADGDHRAFKADPKRCHDGTIEFTSRDSHIGAMPTRRGDLEILGYCLLQWLSGKLPWETNLVNKDWVRDQKLKHMKNINGLMNICFPNGDAPAGLVSYLTYVSTLDYKERPDYDRVRAWFSSHCPGTPGHASAARRRVASTSAVPDTAAAQSRRRNKDCQPTSAASINGHSPALATAARASGGRVKPGHSQGVQKAQQVVDSSERAISSPHWDIPSPQRGIRSSPRGVPGPHQDAVVRDTPPGRKRLNAKKLAAIRSSPTTPTTRALPNRTMPNRSTPQKSTPTRSPPKRSPRKRTTPMKSTPKRSPLKRTTPMSTPKSGAGVTAGSRRTGRAQRPATEAGGQEDHKPKPKSKSKPKPLSVSVACQTLPRTRSGRSRVKR